MVRRSTPAAMTTESKVENGATRTRQRRDDAPAERRAADPIVAAIEQRIADGVLKDSVPLPSERLLMEEFNASRTVVREAITALSNRGLIECRPRFRPIVRRLGYETIIDTTGPVIRKLLNDSQGVKNLYDARVFIERGLVRDAALSAGKEDIQALKAALQANKEAIGDSEAFYQTDIGFHRVLYAITRNPIFPAVHEGFTSWLAPQWEKMLRSPERNENNFLAHQRIYTAILERDPDTAEAELCKHLKAAWAHVSVTFNWDD